MTYWRTNVHILSASRGRSFLWKFPSAKETTQSHPLMAIINDDMTLKIRSRSQPYFKTTKTNLRNNSVYNMSFQSKNNINSVNVRTEKLMLKAWNEHFIAFFWMSQSDCKNSIESEVHCLTFWSLSFTVYWFWNIFLTFRKQNLSTYERTIMILLFYLKLAVLITMIKGVKFRSGFGL